MKRLYRSRTDRKLAGVCGGLGAYLDMDPTLIRLLWVFLALATAVVPLLVTYLVAWAIMPEEPVAPSATGTAPGADTSKPDPTG